MAVIDESFQGTPRYRSSLTGQVYSSMQEAQAAETAKTAPPAAAAAAPTGPKLPENFRWDKYIQANNDLRGMDEAQAKQHYLTHGFKENRPMEPKPIVVKPAVIPAAAAVSRAAAPAGPSKELIQAQQQMAAADQARDALLARKRAEMAAVRPQTYKKGGAVKSRRGDGIAKRGFTKGRMV